MKYQNNNIILLILILILLLSIVSPNNGIDSEKFSSIYNVKDLSSKGPKGDKGDKGERGPRGVNGKNGRNGTSVSLARGIIVAWSGSSYRVPRGWLLCNGRNGTPNLSGKFILGGTTPGRRGGSSSIKLSPSNLPPHRHSYKDVFWSEHKHWKSPPGATKTPNPGNLGSRAGQDADNAGFQKKRITGRCNALDCKNTPFSIMPPYYTLCYIMKS